MTNSSSSSSPTATTPSFHCIQCLHESPTLYRKYSGSTIKLTVCLQCGCDVDPYVEREMFLVLMDAVLLRPLAYRHLLLNHHQDDDFMWLLGKKSSSNSNGNLLVWQFVQYIVASSSLQTYLACSWEGYLHYRDNGNYNDDKTPFLLELLYIFPQAVARILVFWTVVHAGLGKCSSSQRLSSLTQQHQQRRRRALVQRTFLAVIWPTMAFSLVTILVQTWENTDTVRYLGSLLIFVNQVLAIYTVAAVQGVSTVACAATIMLSTVASASVSWIVSSLLSEGGGLSLVPCAGFLYTVRHDDWHVSLCFG